MPLYLFPESLRWPVPWAPCLHCPAVHSRTANAGGLEHRNQMKAPPFCPEPNNVLAHLKSKALGRLQGPTRLSPYFPTSPPVPCHSIRPIALHLLLPWPLCPPWNILSAKCLTSDVHMAPRHPEVGPLSSSVFYCIYITSMKPSLTVLFIYLSKIFLMRTIWLS